jgi:hypothetical protein
LADAESGIISTMAIIADRTIKIHLKALRMKKTPFFSNIEIIRL